MHRVVASGKLMVNIWREDFPESNLRLAHRLDASTTGMLVATLTREAAGVVQPQFESRSVTRLPALVKESRSTDTTVDASIDERHINRKRGVSAEGRSAHRVRGLRPRILRDDSTSLPANQRTQPIRILLSQGLPIGRPSVFDDLAAK